MTDLEQRIREVLCIPEDKRVLPMERFMGFKRSWIGIQASAQALLDGHAVYGVVEGKLQVWYGPSGEDCSDKIRDHKE